MFIDNPSIGDWILPENIMEIFNASPAYDFNQNTIIESAEIAMQQSLLDFVKTSNCPGSCWDFHPSKGCYLESDIFEEKIQHSCLATGVRLEVNECVFDYAIEDGKEEKLVIGDCLLDFTMMQVEFHSEGGKNFLSMESSVEDLKSCGIVFTEDDDHLLLESTIQLSNRAAAGSELLISCSYSKTIVKSFLFDTFKIEKEQDVLSAKEEGDFSAAFELDLMGAGPKHDVFIIGSTIFAGVFYDFSATGSAEAPFEYFITNCEIQATNNDLKFPIIAENCPNPLATEYLDLQLTSELVSKMDKTFQFEAFGLAKAEAYIMTCIIEICIESCPKIDCD
ncbi:unnamed protein product [Oikopleura dioica]|uniref:ZP domain-containing protein n=1 Tax=Oikopleura dioica TaxID=34765 RepID=E4X8H9_OIKDI|nr:unnamed protein product [Oikopleura dioica]